MVKITDMRARAPWEIKKDQRQTQGPGSLKGKSAGSTRRGGGQDIDWNSLPDKGLLLPKGPGKIGNATPMPMPALPPVEIEKRLKKIESRPVAGTSLVKKVGDQYEYDKDFVYIAYASALSSLTNGKITNQNDATDFQFTPYNSSGVLLAYRGHFTNKSIYQSGDPTDYTWESTANLAGYTSVERQFTTSTGLVETLGNPTKPGSGVTWTAINAGSSIPANAIWYAERFTLSGVTSNWTIIAVGAYISSGQLVDAAVIADKIANNAITTAKILNDAIDADKIAANAVVTDALAANAVTSTEIAANAVTTGKIVANAITATEIAANAVTANEIQAGSIGVSELAANSVTANAIAANSVTASEILAGTITASEIAADAITANAIATNAVTADAITAGTITADEIASNAITSAKVSADAITVDKIDLDGTLSVTANSGAIRWGKTDGDDITNSGLFIGRNSSGAPRFVIGSTNSFIYFNGTTVSAVGVAESATVGTEENFYSDTSTTHIFTISPLLDEINIQMVGGGGGGGRNGTSESGGSNSNSGTSSIVKVITSGGTTRATYTAAGGGFGNDCGGTGCGGGGSFAAGEAGDNFVHPGGSNHSSFAGTGGAGGAYNTNSAGGDGGTGAGGGGQGQAGGGSAADGGGGGHEGTFYTTTLLKASSHFVSTDYLEITVGAGGQGDLVRSGNTMGVKGGGNGGNGRVRIKGEDT